MDSNNEERKGRGNRKVFDAAREEGKTGRSAENLSTMEEAYVDNYFLCDGDMTKAAKMSGYSEKNIGQTGYKIFQRPKVKAEIMRRRAEIKEHYLLSHEGISGFLTKVVNANLSDFFDLDKDGNMTLKPDALQNGAGVLLDQITVGKDKRVTFKIFSKQAAADMLARHIGYYEVDNNQKKPTGVGIFLPDNGRGDGPANS